MKARLHHASSGIREALLDKGHYLSQEAVSESQFFELVATLGRVMSVTDIRLEDGDRKYTQPAAIAFHQDCALADYVAWYCCRQDAVQVPTQLLDTKDLPQFLGETLSVLCDVYVVIPGEDPVPVWSEHTRHLYTALYVSEMTANVMCSNTFWQQCPALDPRQLWFLLFGALPPVAIKPTPHKGLGLFGTVPFRKGQVLGLYAGEIQPWYKALLQEDKEKQRNPYLMALHTNAKFDKHANVHQWVVNANLYGNHTRYMNHDPEANCEATLWQSFGVPIPVITAKWDIPASGYCRNRFEVRCQDQCIYPVVLDFLDPQSLEFDTRMARFLHAINGRHERALRQSLAMYVRRRFLAEAPPGLRVVAVHFLLERAYPRPFEDIQSMPCHDFLARLCRARKRVLKGLRPFDPAFRAGRASARQRLGAVLCPVDPGLRTSVLSGEDSALYPKKTEWIYTHYFPEEASS